MSKDLEFQPSFEKSKFRTKKMWVEAAYRFSIFSANRIPCLCVFACDELYFSYNSLPMRNRSIVQKY